MRTLKRFLALILVICLSIFPIRAFALEDDDEEWDDEFIERYKMPETIENIDQLNQALLAAKDYDTLVISGTIIVENDVTLSTDKHISLVRDTNFKTRPLIEIKQGTISGFTFFDVLGVGDTVKISANNYLTAAITDCAFYGNVNNDKYMVYIQSGKDVKISNTSFFNNGGCAVNCHATTTSIISNCYFENNTSRYVVLNPGIMTLQNCILKNNICLSNAVFNRGKLFIRNCEIINNTLNDSDTPVDICSWSDGTLWIYQDEDNGIDYYNSDNEKIDLPLINHYGMLSLHGVMRSDSIEDTTSDSNVSDTDNPPETHDDTAADNNNDNPADTNTGNDDDPPADNTEGNNDNPPEKSEETNTGDENISNTPTEPPEDNDNTDNSDNPSENPEDTDNGDNTDNPAPADNDNTEDSGEPDITPEPTEQPITPPSSRGNTTHYPTPTPTQPMGTPIEDEPEEQPTKAIPALVCNGARLDITRSVKLQGYGDGNIYENEPITRAQAATIIYRLLDNDSIAALEDVAPVNYVDVDSAAWYAPYVQAVSKAGIFSGIGAGRYDPNAPLTWQQLIVVLSRFAPPQEYDLKYIRCSEWATPALQTAVYYGWLADNPCFMANAEVSRADAAVYINYIMELSRLQ